MSQSIVHAGYCVSLLSTRGTWHDMSHFISSKTVPPTEAFRRHLESNVQHDRLVVGGYEGLGTLLAGEQAAHMLLRCSCR